MPVRLACLAALVFLAGCATSAPPERPAAALPDLLRLAQDDPEALLRRLPEPARVEAEPVENRHVPGQTDTLRTFVYAGLRVQVYDVAAGDGRRLVQEVTVTGTDYVTADGLRVGDTRDEVRGALGEPLGIEGEALVYEVPDGPDDPTPALLYVQLEGGRVAALRWSFYVD